MKIRVSKIRTISWIGEYSLTQFNDFLTCGHICVRARIVMKKKLDLVRLNDGTVDLMVSVSSRKPKK